MEIISPPQYDKNIKDFLNNKNEYKLLLFYDYLKNGLIKKYKIIKKINTFVTLLILPEHKHNPNPNIRCFMYPNLNIFDIILIRSEYYNHKRKCIDIRYNMIDERCILNYFNIDQNEFDKNLDLMLLQQKKIIININNHIDNNIYNYCL